MVPCLRGWLASTVATLEIELKRPTFAEIVISLHRRGLSVGRSELTRRMGVSKGTVSSLMNDHAQPGIDLLLRLSTSYGVQLPELLWRRGTEEAWLHQSREGRKTSQEIHLRIVIILV